MLDVCRICLCTGGRMFTMNKYKLQDTFEHITGIALQEDNTLPRMLCTECTQKLSNCEKLIAKSLQANAILTELAIQHGDLTSQIIETIDRNINQLHSNLHTKLYEPDHYDYLIEHTDEQTDINIADMELKTESIDETFLDENDVFADEETWGEQGVEDHISESAECQKAADSKNKTEGSLIGNEFRKRLVVMLERMEFKYENDIGIDIEDSVTECGLVVKEEYPGENTSIGRQGDHFSDRQMYSSSSGRPPLSNSMLVLDDDNEKRTETEVQNTEHVKDTAKEVQERPLTDHKTETKSGETPRVQLDIISTTKGHGTVTINAEKNKKPINYTIPKKRQLISIRNKVNTSKDTNSIYFACDSCSFVTSLKCKLIKHVKSHENKKCKVCNKKFTRTGNLKVHLRVHTGERPYSCEICGKKFIQNCDLSRHQRIHTGEKPYSCEICGKKFTGSTSLRYHVGKHTGKKQYSCEICSKKFILNGDLSRHQRIHTGEKPYSCEICGKKFTDSSSLIYHVRKHTGKKQYSCEICSKKFIQNGDLSRHQRIHTGEKPYSCEICGKKFTDSSSLRYHVRKHTGKKQYSCEICSKKFIQNGDLSRHQRIHTGEKPYSCEICGKKFTDSSSLRYHVRKHTGKKQYSCEICSKKFIQNGDLSRHQRIHTGEKRYSCEICGKKFTDSSSLRYHVRKHTGKKQYSCEICSKKFIQNSDLIRHQRIHTGKKPYSCEICGKKFTDSSSLRYHVRKHTGKK